MTKRCGSYQSSNGKKPRLDDDEIWDEDLDDEVIDKCFELATQVCQGDETRKNDTQIKEVSILPTYSVFKNPSGFSSSTQANITVSASTSKRPVFYELEAEVQRLKIQNEEKDGEISILRTKIKEASTIAQVEQKKTTNEWREKLLQTQKEARLVKSDLEFKNLEIANLKQQLNDLRRINLDATLNATQQCAAREPQVKVNYERSIAATKNDIDDSKSSASSRNDHKGDLAYREAIVESVYPLKCVSPSNFERTVENHVIKHTSYKISRNTIPYLQNQHTYNESNFYHKCARLGNKKIRLECVYSDVLKLVNCTVEDLKSDYCVEAVNKLICVTTILLQDLSEYLVEFGLHLRAEDIQQADTNYLLKEQDTCTKINQNEMGIQSGKILDVLSQLILYNPYAANFICGCKSLKLLPNTKEYAKLIPHRNSTIQNECYLLKLLLTIVTNIGKYRLANQMNGFLISLIKLLINIGILDNKNYMYELMDKRSLYCNIFKEIVFARPGPIIIERLTCLLKVGSHYKTFVQYLFGKNGKNPLVKAESKGVLYYTEDACSFCVLGVLLQNYSIKTEKIPLEVYNNMVIFIYNTFKKSHWIHHDNVDTVCVCLSQLYKLEMEFVFRALKDFVKYFDKGKKCQVSDEWNTFLRHEIVQKVINQMNFNNFELTEKYVMVYSQFKEIESVLKNEGRFNITQLNTSEELIKIPTAKFRQDF